MTYQPRALSRAEIWVVCRYLCTAPFLMVAGLLLCIVTRRWDRDHLDRVRRLAFTSCPFYLALALYIGVFVTLSWMWHEGPPFYLSVLSGVVGMVFAIRYMEVTLAFVRRLVRTTDRPEGPPRTAQYLLFLVPPKYRDNLVGDLEEEYRTLLPTYGRRWTDRWYWWQVGAAFGHFVVHLLAGLAAVWKMIR